MTETNTAGRTIFSAINAVQKKLASEGISKDQRNEHGRYNFRGIDDLYNAMSPLLADAGLVIVPRLKKVKLEQTYTSNNKLTNQALVTVDYTIFDTHGDSIEASFPGEAMDTSDKAVNKAMTAAFKYLMFELFCIPVEGSPDADQDNIQMGAPPQPQPAPYAPDVPYATHAPDMQPAPVPQPVPQAQPEPSGPVTIADEFGANETASAMLAIARSMHSDSLASLQEFWRLNKAVIDEIDSRFPAVYQYLQGQFTAIKAEIQARQQA